MGIKESTRPMKEYTQKLGVDKLKTIDYSMLANKPLLFFIFFVVVFFIAVAVIQSTFDNAVSMDTAAFSGSNTILSDNGTANTLSQTPSSLTSVTNYNRTWLSFDGSNDFMYLSSAGVESVSYWYSNATKGWTHVVNSSGTFYVDGVAATPEQVHYFNNGSDLLFGRNSTNFINVSIDDVRAFNVTLNATNVATIFANGRAKNFSDVQSSSIGQINSTLVSVKNGSITSLSFSPQTIHSVNNWNMTFINLTYASNSGIVNFSNPTSLRFGQNNFTISFWINTSTNMSSTSGGSNTPLIMCRCRFSGSTVDLLNINLNSLGNVFVTFGSDPIGTTNISSTIKINDSRWHNVIINKGDNITNISNIYIDGVLDVTNATFFDNLTINSASLREWRIGQAIGSSFGGIPGQLDELRIYNKTLNTTEVSLIYNSSRYANYSLAFNTLVLWQPFNENSGTLAYDHSGLNNTGIITSIGFRNDAIYKNLTLNIDYNLSTNQFTLNNFNYEFSELNITGTNLTNKVVNKTSYLPLSENSGTKLYDQTAGDNGTLVSGVAWGIDGITQTVPSTAYSQSGATFTIINTLYAWRYMNVSYNYNLVTPTASSNLTRLTGLMIAIVLIILLTIPIIAYINQRGA